MTNNIQYEKATPQKVSTYIDPSAEVKIHELQELEFWGEFLGSMNKDPQILDRASMGSVYQALIVFEFCFTS